VTSRVRTKSRVSPVALLSVFLAGISAVCLAAGNGEDIDLNVVTRIRQEGFRNSKAMDILQELTDRIGPRVTGSPNMKCANDWAREKLIEFGLSNAHLESYGPVGRGWSEELTWVRMTSPDTTMLIAQPRAWSSSTKGAEKGEVVALQVESKSDLERYRGKLSGKIVLLGRSREVRLKTSPASSRFSDDQIRELAQSSVPDDRRPVASSADARRRAELNDALPGFLENEKVVAAIEPSQFDDGILTSTGGERERGRPAGVPTLNMAVEHWGRINRLLERKIPVQLELNIQTKYYDDGDNVYNTIAEIPGADKKDEIVIVGGHLDSWHGGTGATDNATGVSAAMEAVRILKALDIRPRRTIRIGLWSGEEQGLLGSRAYVQQHLAAAAERAGELQIKNEYDKTSVYFNLDAGSGRIRGILGQENAAARSIFEQWIVPFHDLGVTTATMRGTGSTDHIPFDAVGVPGFSFIQDTLEYFTHTHHTNLDVYERVSRTDLMQQAVVLAWFAYQAAMRDGMMPRKPLLKPGMNSREELPPGLPVASPTGSR
jgi:carboxypeptidase Q